MNDEGQYKVFFSDSEFLCQKMLDRDPTSRTICILSTHRLMPVPLRAESLLRDVFEHAQDAFWRARFEHPSRGEPTLSELMQGHGALQVVLPLWIEVDGGIFIETRSGDLFSITERSKADWMRKLYSMHNSPGLGYLRKYGRPAISHDLGL